MKTLTPSKQRYVHALLQGKESELTINLLVELTSFTSESIKACMYQHYVKGLSDDMCCMIYDVKRQNFNRAVKRINEVYSIVQQLNGR